MKRLAINFVMFIAAFFLFFLQKSFAQNNENLSLISVVPMNGPCLSGVLVGNTAYFGNGIFLQVTDFSNPAQPVELSKIRVNDYIRDIVVKDRYAYITSMKSLKIIDISDPSNPFEAGSVNTMGRAMRITLDNNRAYLALKWDGFQMIDVSDPTNPAEIISQNNELAWWDTDHVALDVAVNGNYAYVADGLSGLRIIGVSDPFKMYEKGFYDMPGMARAVALQGNYAYVANSRRGLSVIDISNPSNPVEKTVFDTDGFVWDVVISGTNAFIADQEGLRILDIANSPNLSETGYLETPGNSSRVTVRGDYACTANRWTGFRLIDVSNPSNPREAGYFETGDVIQDVAVNDGMLYMAKGRNGLIIMDMSDPRHPKEKGVFNRVDNVYGLTVKDHYAYLADDDKIGLQIIDISDPASPSETGTFDTPGNAMDVAVKDEYAYVADGNEGLRIITVSEPSQPSEAGFFDTNGFAQGIAAAGHYVYVADGGQGLRIIDVSNPASPAEIGFFNTAGNAVDVAVDSQYVYIADGWNGLRIIDVSNPSQPYEAGYIDVGESATRVLVEGDYIYLTDSDLGLFVIDASDPAHPVVKGSYDPLGYAYSEAVEGKYVYVGASGYGLYVLRNDLLKEPVKFLTHRTGDLIISVFENGYLGRNIEDQTGIGVIYRGNGNALFAGSILLGDDERVLGLVYNNPHDFLNMEHMEGFTSDEHFSRITYCAFNDFGSENPFDVKVHQYTYSDSLNDFVYFQYRIQNQSGANINGLYTGIFADWDIGDAGSNMGGYDAERGMAYEYEFDDGNILNTCYYGVIALSGMAGARVTPSQDYSRQDSLFSWMSTFRNEPFISAGDYRTYIGSGPFNLQNDEEVVVAFAIVAGTNLTHLQENADKAIQKWRTLSVSVETKNTRLPNDYYLSQNYPNPFNPGTRIGFQIPEPGLVIVKIFNTLGVEIRTLIHARYDAGAYRINWDGMDKNGRPVPSGVYFYQLKAGNFTQVKKMSLMR